MLLSGYEIHILYALTRTPLRTLPNLLVKLESFGVEVIGLMRIEPQLYLGKASNLAVHLARLLEDMLWCDEAMKCKLPEPVWDMKDAVVAISHVRGGHDLADFGID